jgi:hypothetical protein
VEPTSRQIRTVAAALVAVGFVACAVAIFTEQLGLSSEEARGMFGWKRASLLAVGAALVAIGAVLLVRPRSVLWGGYWQRTGGYFLSEPHRHYLGFGLLVVLGLVLVWTRLIRIEESFWHDEVVTVMTFSGQGLGPILFGETVYSPNNHVLYNLLSWATTSLLVKTEALYRFWSVVPAIAAIAAGAWWAWRRLGAVVAIAFAALAIAVPMHMELAPQARGYGLALLAATLMLIAADRVTRACSKRPLLGFLGAGLLGIWTLHIFAAAFIGQALSLLKWPNLRRPVIAAVGAAGLLSLLFYAPVLDGIISGERPRGEIISLDAALTLDRTRGWLIAPIMMVVTGGRPADWVSLAALALMAVAIVGLWRRGDLGLALILVVPPLVFNLFVSVGELNTVSRHQFLLLTHMLLLVAVGIGELARIVTRYRPLRPVAVAAGVVAVLALARTTVQWEAKISPFENFSEVAAVIEQADEHTVVTDSVRPDGLRYYLGDRLLELLPEEIERRLCEPGRSVVYVRHLPISPFIGPHPEIHRAEAGYRHPPRLECLTRKRAVRVRVPQRARGDAIDLWIVEPRRPSRATIADDLPNAPDPWYERHVE